MLKKQPHYTALQGIDKIINWIMKQSRRIGPTRQTQYQRAKRRKGMHYSDIQIWKQKRERSRIGNRYIYKGVSKRFEARSIDRQPMAVLE